MPLSFEQDVLDNSPFLLSAYGNHLALGFRGTPTFVARCHNWAINTGVIGPEARVMWYQGECGRLGYVCPKTMRAIRRGVFLQLRAEIILAGEIPLKADHSRDDDWNGEGEMLEYNDYAIARLGLKRTKAFMRDHIVRDSFLVSRPSIAHIYSVTSTRPDQQNTDE